MSEKDSRIECVEAISSRIKATTVAMKFPGGGPIEACAEELQRYQAEVEAIMLEGLNAEELVAYAAATVASPKDKKE